MSHRHKHRRLRLRPHAAALLLVLATPALGASGIFDLGTLGGAATIPTGISADGSVVVGWGYTGAGLVARAFRWTSGGGMVGLGTLGGSSSQAYGVSADGAVVVGIAYTAGDAANFAFRWTSGGGMVNLGTLGGTTFSRANGVSADGAVVVGEAQAADGDRAFRWTSGGGMVDLGTLGGRFSAATGVSADGAVVVGHSYTAGDVTTRAFRWTSVGGMVDLGTLGGSTSSAFGVSADGAVVVGEAYTAGDRTFRAFRWTSSGGMVDLGALGGTVSWAQGVSADGAVVVGSAFTAGDRTVRAFRWTSGSGMLSVEDWLRAAGVPVPVDITSRASATNSDGSVVVGTLADDRAFIARVASIGSGLITLADLQQSLANASYKTNDVFTKMLMWALNGAHSRPLSRRVGAGQRAFWLAGDWGRDDHGESRGRLGMAEAGLGKNFGPAQINISLGKTWAKQDLAFNGRARSEGTYLLAQALVPLYGSLWATLGGYHHWGQSDIERGYLNAGAPDTSKGSPDANTRGLRARLEWDQAWRLAGAGVSPYVDLTYSEVKIPAYTETGGGFPARFDSRNEKATELRLGVNAERPMANGVTLFGVLEAAHRFEKTGARISGQVLGLFDFTLDGQKNKQDWLRVGMGVEGKLAQGRASLSLNATTTSGQPNVWLAAGWQRAF
jgi:probable HAF family extracellular repeat protein